MSNELTVIENVQLIPFFTKGDSVDEILAKIAEEARSHVPDVSTKKGRDAIKANVTLVTKSKTYLENNGKELAAEYKEIPKKIDANRKKVKDFLTNLQAELRQPLTDYENEQKRIKAEKEAAELAIKQAEEIERDHEMALLMDAEFNRQREELARQAAEAERLRLEQAEKDRIEYEARIAREAKEAAELAHKESAEKAERDRLAAIEREEQYKRDAIAAEERAKVQAEQAEKQRIESEERAKREAAEAAELARQTEIKRQQDEAKRIADEQAKREADNKHIGSIRKQTKESIMALGIDEETAKTIVMAIHNKQIANVSIAY